MLSSDPGNTEPEHQKNRILPKKRLIPLNNIGARRTLCLEYKTIFFKKLKIHCTVGKRCFDVVIFQHSTPPFNYSLKRTKIFFFCSAENLKFQLAK